MPGLFVAHLPGGQLGGRSETAEALELLAWKSRVSEWTDPESFLTTAAVVGPETGHSMAEADDGTWCRVYGRVFVPDAGPRDENNFAAAVLRCYRDLGAACLDALDGEFTLVIVDPSRSRMLVANDRFSMRPWYVVRSGDAFVLSPELKGLLPFLRQGPKPDRPMLLAFLAFNKIRLGDRTLVHGISVLPAASRWTVDLRTGRLDTRTDDTFRYNEERTEKPIDDDRLDDLVAAYRAAMQKCCRSASDLETGLSLSGGLDSRTMVAALGPQERELVTAHTYGLPDSDEVRLAGAVAAAAGMKQVVHPLDAGDYAALAADGMRYNDEMDLFVQGAQVRWLESAGRATRIMTTGLDLDVTLGGIYLEDDVFEARNDEDVFGLLRRKNAVFSDEDLRRTLTDSFWTENAESCFDLARELVRDLPQESAPAKYDLFIHRYSMRRVIMLRYALIRYFMDTASPMYDASFITRVADLPLSRRAGHRTFVSFLQRLSPVLADIPYQRTLLPASVPRRFWARGAAIEKEREALYRDIWRETGGRIFVPYRRFYTNYDEWLRCDPAWLALTDDLLGSSRARIYADGIARQESVADLVAAHRGGRPGYRQKLVCLMTLELYLREMF